MKRYAQLLDRLATSASGCDFQEYGRVEEQGETYPLVRVSVPGPRALVITAGFHGEEPAGPLTIAEHLSQLLEWVRAAGQGLVVYPCINPSGFEHGSRYNLSGERPNNDFLRYEVEPGSWRGELAHGEDFLRFELFREGPKETRALLRDLETLPAPAAALDLHQDNYLARVCTYAYVFGDPETYLPAVQEASRHAEVAASCAVDDQHDTDDLGLVWAHDGSVTDYFHRRGVAYTAAVETTTRTPLKACFDVNLAWIRGFLALAGGD